ncbi:MAG: hypothetical protein R3D57_10785 [Hyphomicrobiaceae bacterium]
MLAEPILQFEEEIAPATAVATAVIAVIQPKVDPLRHARAQVQRSILTYSVLSRVLGCGADLPSYERILREFIWTPSSTGR